MLVGASGLVEILSATLNELQMVAVYLATADDNQRSVKRKRKKFRVYLLMLIFAVSQTYRFPLSKTLSSSLNKSRGVLQSKL